MSKPGRKFTNGRGEGREGDGYAGSNLTSWTYRDATPGSSVSTSGKVADGSVYLRDPDVTLYHGDVLAVLRELPAESVDCCVTSPPYWGLRDYGTGAWEGGDEECDHLASNYDRGVLIDATQRTTPGGASAATADKRRTPYRTTCGKCGATRIDQQLGLESTPEEYVTRMVEVFREVRRVLAAHGTVWLNLGDSYAAQGGGKAEGQYEEKRVAGATYQFPRSAPAGLKPKDLVGVPWRVAFALQADGWYLRSDIIWAKPNPMPESVTDRPTKAHEYVFLLSKQAKYFFDQEAVREEAEFGRREWTSVEGNLAGVGLNGSRGHATVRDFRKPPQDETLDGSEGEAPRGPDGRRKTTVQGADGSLQHRDGERWPNGGRNIRSVWEIATQPYPEAHFATFPEELARRCIAAGCPEQVCRVCGRARERVVERTLHPVQKTFTHTAPRDGFNKNPEGHIPAKQTVETLGFTDCGHSDYRPGVTLDPFMGSGTVAHVARKLGRHAVGIDLNESYLKLAARRLQQQSLFAEVSS